MKSKTQLQNLRAKNRKDLFKELTDSQKKLTELRFNLALKKLKNYHEITTTRRKIARLWTILGEKIEAEQKPERMKNDKA